MSGEIIRKHKEVINFTYCLQHCVINAPQFFNDTVKEMFHGQQWGEMVLKVLTETCLGVVFP